LSFAFIFVLNAFRVNSFSFKYSLLILLTIKVYSSSIFCNNSSNLDFNSSWVYLSFVNIPFIESINPLKSSIIYIVDATVIPVKIPPIVAPINSEKTANGVVLRYIIKLSVIIPPIAPIKVALKILAASLYLFSSFSAASIFFADLTIPLKVSPINLTILLYVVWNILRITVIIFPKNPLKNPVENSTKYLLDLLSTLSFILLKHNFSSSHLTLFLLFFL